MNQGTARGLQLESIPERIPYHSGILPEEMMCFITACHKAGVETIIESGRGMHAYSTRFLAEYSQAVTTSSGRLMRLFL